MLRHKRAFVLLMVLAIFADSFVLSFPTYAQSQAQPQSGEAEQPTGDEWPREIDAASALVVLYQPQPETFQGNRLTARAAVSVTPQGETEPRFGAVWFEARVATDRTERTVDLLEVRVPRVTFAAVPEDKKARLRTLLEAEIPKWDIEISLDRLLTSLQTADVKRNLAKGLKSEPPTILFVTEPTELVIFDGQPELRSAEGGKVMKVINTLSLIVLHPGTRTYFLNVGKNWMSAPDWKGPWKLAPTPPAEVVALTPAPDAELEKEEPDEGIVPKVVVVTEPVEMITCDGEPKYKPLEGNELLFVSNTGESVLLEIASQTHFVLLAGRWFKSNSLQGPWEYVASDKLPASFAKIPADSDVGDLRAFVAGTDEAGDAVMDAQIPQTAAIKRGEAKLEVTYDGEPKFEPIKETTLAYSINTSSAVIRVTEGSKTSYYCCANAVWYVAPGPSGPWSVAVEVPAAIYSIPPSSPVYNVTYVRIYSSTPTVVYVGYLPGYNHCYVYGGTVVYGTGYTYTVWVGTVYYAQPVTYGYSYSYYPRLGRWFSPYSIGGVVRRTRRRTRRRVRHHSYRHAGRHHGNHYSRNRARASHRSQPSRSHAARTSNRSRTQSNRNRGNNVYADRNGNVHRRNQNGSWDRNTSGGWSSSSGRSSSSMQGDHNARQRGTSRTNEYNSSRSSSSRSSSSRSSSSRSGGGSGGSRGGGGRR